MTAYAVSIEGSMAGQVIINSLAGFTGVAGPVDDVEEANGVAVAFRDLWQARILPSVSNQYTFVGVTARGVNNPLVSAFASSTAGTGGAMGTSLPTFACAKVSLQTATPGPAGRGRTGICGIDEAATTAALVNRIDSGTQNALQVGMDGILSGLLTVAKPINLSVISRFKGVDGQGKPIPRVDGPLASFVTSIVVRSELGTRVSRLR